MSAFELTAPEVEALCAFSSRDQTRGHLCNVLFEPSSGSVVACDGHTLIRRAQEATEGDKFLIDSKVLRRAAGFLVKRSPMLVSHGQILVAGLTIQAPTPEFRFPPWEQVMPKPTKKPPIGVFSLDPEYLARIRLMCRAAREQGVVIHTGSSDLDPVKFTAGNWTAILMPRRIWPASTTPTKPAT